MKDAIATPATTIAQTASGTAASLRTRQVRTTGSNHVGMRQFNERVVLQAIRLNGPTPKADLARLTRLSTQTVGGIVGDLIDDGLVLKRPPQRGRVGQPSVPIALCADGAYSVGIKIGRRSLDVLLIDFVGAPRLRLTRDYAYPEPQMLFDEIDRCLDEIRRFLGPKRQRRLVGIGIAAPLSLDGWQQLLGIAPARAGQWKGVDIRARVQALTRLPVSFVKDTIAACTAELVSGRGKTLRNFVYLFIDTFIGGGLVIDSQIHGGLNGNAGAVASLPLTVGTSGTAPPQLLSVASLFQLEASYDAAGLDPGAMGDSRALETPWATVTEGWIATASPAIALAIINATALLDQEGVIIDGNLGRPLLDRLIDTIRAAMDRYDWEGLVRPEVFAGSVGSDARAIGGALSPLYANFAPDSELFLK